MHKRSPARWADASLARVDPMFKKLNLGEYNHFSFELDRKEDEPIEIHGAYVIVDMGISIGPQLSRQ